MADAVVTPASRLSVYERSAIFLGARRACELGRVEIATRRHQINRRAHLDALLTVCERMIGLDRPRLARPLPDSFAPKRTLSISH